MSEQALRGPHAPSVFPAQTEKVKLIQSGGLPARVISAWVHCFPPVYTVSHGAALAKN